MATSKETYDKFINVMKNQGCNVRYYHEMIGYNYRLEGITNLKFTLQAHPESTETVFHLFEVEVEGDPEEFLAYMKRHDIECNRHYPVPCHLQEAYAHLGYKEGDCPNAEYLASHCATLPLFPEMTDEEVSIILNKYLE